MEARAAVAGGGRVPNPQTSVREEEGRAGKSTRQWIRESSERHSWEDKTREDGTPTEKVPINSGGTDWGGRGGLSHQSAKRSPLSLLTGRLAQLTATERDSITRRERGVVNSPLTSCRQQICISGVCFPSLQGPTGHTTNKRKNRWDRKQKSADEEANAGLGAVMERRTQRGERESETRCHRPDARNTRSRLLPPPLRPEASSSAGGD